MGVIEAMLLGAVQGLTEFLPISSSGHLVLVRELLGINKNGALAFDAVLHFATALAVLVYFRWEIWRLLKSTIKLILRKKVKVVEKNMLSAILIATIPAVIFGIMLEKYMEIIFRNPLLVAGGLAGGSLIMFLAEKWHVSRIRVAGEQDVPNPPRALTIGLFQSLALIPGMSRSGMAISGGMLMGLSRADSARFAFLLAIPLLLGAGGKKLLELGANGSLFSDAMALAAGTASAFIVGILVVHYLLKFLRNHSLMVFVWYRLVLAGLVILIVLV
jgi:undecaprenyl-diphosphatase